MAHCKKDQSLSQSPAAGLAEALGFPLSPLIIPVVLAPHSTHPTDLMSLSPHSNCCSSKSFLLLPGSEM